MKKLTLFTIGLVCALTSVAQITKQNELFETVPIIEGKAVFIKEVAPKKVEIEDAYSLIESWARDNYGRDPFISSARFDAVKKEVVAKSRIELLLPENSKGVRKKMIMRYRIDSFIKEDKCVLQITELSYLLENSRERKLPRVIRAEDFITASKVLEVDELQELRVNTRKSTLFFLNELSKEFEKALGY